MSSEPQKSSAAQFAPLVLIPIALWAIAGGLYLTYHHDMYLYGGVQVEMYGCQADGVYNCDIVNTSAWSELFGIPVGIWSTAAWSAVIALAAANAAKINTRALLLVGGVIAVLSSAFMFYQSWFILQYLCKVCLLTQYLPSLALLGVGAFAFASDEDRAVPPPAFGVGAAAMVALMVVGGVGERVWRGSLIGVVPEALTSADGGNRVEVMNSDPKGPAPTRTFTVTTEAGEQASFTLDEDDAWRGNPEAKVAVVEFADLQCGYCKRESVELDRLFEAYGDRVLFVFKHFPMNPDCNPGVQNKKHGYACKAARASVCARKQGKFWDYATLAFKNQHQLGDDYLRLYGDNVGLDLNAFDACMNGNDSRDEVYADATVGKDLGIKGTPRIFINGKLYRAGSSAEVMAQAIEEALGASAGDAKAAAAAMHENESGSDTIPADIPEMQTISVGTLKFKIDTFEAAIVDGKAVSAKHEIPAIRVNWYEAKAACEASGKRLCTEREWVSACQNAVAIDENNNGEYADDLIEGTAYPYSDYHDASACWDGHETSSDQASPWRPVYTGEMPRCATPTGVYDMSGNVEEWAGDTPENASMLGGAFDTSEDHARCYRRNDRFGAGYSTIRSGFRCCADP